MHIHLTALALRRSGNSQAQRTPVNPLCYERRPLLAGLTTVSAFTTPLQTRNPWTLSRLHRFVQEKDTSLYTPTGICTEMMASP